MRSFLCHIYDCRMKEDRAEGRKKVVVLRELCRAIIYTTEMSKQVTKSHVRM
jgi:hypothetical protein